MVHKNLNANGNGIAGTGFGGAGSFAQSGLGIIAFGTIAGGVGASLSGGNFWQGAVTGLVVSAYNHVEHMQSEDYDSIEKMKSQIDKEVDAYYESPDSVAPNNDATLYAMKNNLPTLKNQYTKVGSPKLMHENAYMDGFDQATTYSYNDDKYNKSYSHFYGKSFSSYRNLAYTMLHEFGHALHFFNGSFLIASKTSNNISSWKEDYAYKYALSIGGIKYVNGTIIK